MRLQRYGKRGKPFYHIVIADGRAPRDGRFIENIGTYNPLTVPADININFEKAMDWLQKGVQPTDTVRAILAYKGILYKYHLQKGVLKGALTQAQADNRFTEWLTAKEAKISARVKEREMSKKESRKHKLESEFKIKEAREKEIAKKRAAAMEAEAEARKEELPVAELAQPEIREPEQPPQPVAEVKVEAKTEEPEVQVIKTEEPEVEEIKAEDTKAEETTEEAGTEEAETK